MQNKIIIANWKMNGSFDEAQNWLEKFNQKIFQIQTLPKIILCPSSIMIDHIDGLLMESEFNEIEKLQSNKIEEINEDDLDKLIVNLRRIRLGGQDCARQESGAFTGDISAKMLKDAGCEYVILGHCERRKYHNESNEMIAEKISQAIVQELTPILCVGEAKELRDENKFADFISRQLQNSIPKNLKINNLIIAYEPVWSIGTGLVPTISQIEEVADLIKKTVSINKNIAEFKIIYGGSIKSDNSKEISLAKNIDGLLVGGASLNPDEFWMVIKNFTQIVHE